jgi:RNA polymerase sigma factor (sigma-70 family)
MESESLAAYRQEPVPATLRLASDAHLVEQVHAGSEQAFEALFHRYHTALLQFCARMLGSLPEAEDAVQLTFMAAYRDLARAKRPAALRPWLYAIARHRCLNALRDRRERPLAHLPEVAVDHLASEVATRADLRAILADLALLPTDQRQALVLAELGDASHEEIARLLGCPQKKVKALVFQARTSLAAARSARETPCMEIRDQLSSLRGGALRRALLSRHLDACPSCRAFRDELRAERRHPRLLLPLGPVVGLKRFIGALTHSGEAGGALLSTGALAVGRVAATALAAIVIPAGGIVALNEARNPPPPAALPLQWTASPITAVGPRPISAVPPAARPRRDGVDLREPVTAQATPTPIDPEQPSTHAATGATGAAESAPTPAAAQPATTIAPARPDLTPSPDSRAETPPSATAPPRPPVSAGKTAAPTSAGPPATAPPGAGREQAPPARDQPAPAPTTKPSRAANAADHPAPRDDTAPGPDAAKSGERQAPRNETAPEPDTQRNANTAERHAPRNDTAPRPDTQHTADTGERPAARNDTAPRPDTANTAERHAPRDDAAPRPDRRRTPSTGERPAPRDDAAPRPDRRRTPSTGERPAPGSEAAPRPNAASTDQQPAPRNDAPPESDAPPSTSPAPRPARDEAPDRAPATDAPKRTAPNDDARPDADPAPPPSAKQTREESASGTGDGDRSKRPAASPR